MSGHNDNLIDRLRPLIAGEDPRRPLTDREMAAALAVRRDEVTLARREAGIPDSRQRLRPRLSRELKEMLTANPNLSDREVVRELRGRGFSISRFVVAAIRAELDTRHRKSARPGPVEKQQRAGQPESTGTQLEIEADPFTALVGVSGSLRTQVQQAKAAVLYPPHGLHTLILGPAGVGKNELASAMYRFALLARGLPPSTPFVEFNCADYADNPQLLLAQLFGSARGAFTGADRDRLGLIEQADEGIMFLDEVHRLPPEGQEILFHLIDRGRFRRLGETETERRARVMIIAATTENPDSALLMTFRRRIPMVIELPALTDRPLGERYDTCKTFFREEAARTRVPIQVSAEALRALLVYPCPGNVGQLKSDIQVACARGFLAHVTEHRPDVVVDATALPVHVRRALLNASASTPDLDSIVTGDLVVAPGRAEVRIIPKDDIYTLPEKVYQFIEERYRELRGDGFQETEINRLIGEEVEVRLRQQIYRVERNLVPALRDDLANVVGRELVDAVDRMFRLVEGELGTVDRRLFYCVAIHLGAALDRLRRGKAIVNPHLDKIRREYGREFNLAREMVAFLSRELDLGIPEDEAGFIAMYLRSGTQVSARSEGRVGILVLSHGRVANGMAEVANRLLGTDHARALEMSLEESPAEVVDRAVNLARQVNEGKGILLLADMGSLLNLGSLITEQTGIPTRSLDRVDTVMVIEATRWALLPEATLEQVVDGLRSSRRAGAMAATRQILVTICLTGAGAARKLKERLKTALGDRPDLEIIPVGALDHPDLRQTLADLGSRGRLVAVVGSVEPPDPSLPFIPIERAIGNQGLAEIRALLSPAPLPSSPVRGLSTVIDADFIFLRQPWRSRPRIIRELCRRLADAGRVGEDYCDDVFRREEFGPTFIPGGVAIPHAGPDHVLRPTIAIATLASPIDWSGQKVDLVCLLALGTMARETFQQLYTVLGDEQQLARLRAASSPAEAKEIIVHECNRPHPQ